MAAIPFQPMMESRPIREIAYEVLKHAIITGEIPAGERIVETEYADRLHISRTPLREALRKLERDGLVVRHDFEEVVPHVEYSLSDTGPNHSAGPFDTCVPTAICVNPLPGAAPCQCITPGAIFTTSPGCSSRIAPPFSW